MPSEPPTLSAAAPPVHDEVHQRVQLLLVPAELLVRLCQAGEAREGWAALARRGRPRASHEQEPFERTRDEHASRGRITGGAWAGAAPWETAMRTRVGQ